MDLYRKGLYRKLLFRSAPSRGFTTGLFRSKGSAPRQQFALESVKTLFVRSLGRTTTLIAIFVFIAGSPAFAQYAKYDAMMPPEFKTTDERQVDLVTGILQWSNNDLSIGPEGAGLSHALLSKGGYLFTHNISANDNWSIVLVTGAPCPPIPNQTVLERYCVSIDLGNSSTTFAPGNGGYTRIYSYASGPAYQPNSMDRLVKDGSRFIYTDRNGANYIFGSAASNFGVYVGDSAYALDEIQKPDGQSIKVFYKNYNGFVRKQAVVSSYGFMLKFFYSAAMETIPAGAGLSSAGPAINPSSIVAVNLAVEACDPMADFCTFVKSWPTVTYATDVVARTLTVTDQNGLVKVISTNEYGHPIRIQDSFGYTNIAYEAVTSYSSTVLINLNGAPWYFLFNNVMSVDVDGSVWRYSKTPKTPPTGGGFGSAESIRIFDPYDNQSTLGISYYNRTYDDYSWRPAGRSTAQRLRYNVPNFLIRSEDFEGQVFTYTPDTRGNNTELVVTPKPGSGLATVTTTAGYDSTCVYAAKCNQPNWTRDGNGNQSDFQYDLSTGLIVRATRPADAAGVRGVTRYAYVQRYAWIASAGGGYVQSGNPITLPASEKTCLTTATVGDGCSGGAADEVVIAYDYGPDSGPNNLSLRGKTVLTNGQVSRWCYGYDALGNRIYETTPNAGLTVCS